MKILFCNDDLDSRSVDNVYANELEAALASGFGVGLIDFNAIRRRDENDAFRRLSQSSHEERAIYRGWMLTPGEYEFLHSSLRRRNVLLVATPEQYLHCHWLPNSYATISEVTPRSVWIPVPECFDMATIMMAIKQFQAAPLILKDYVKSRKHEWKEACFIPDSSDEVSVARVVKRFLELQDDDLQGGLVFREFLELNPVGFHPKSGMPLTQEYRLFVVNGDVISVCPYWDAEYAFGSPPVESFLPVLSQVQSPFFSCDIARQMSGEWTIVELGDGQVAGLPERCEVTTFYLRLSSKFQD